MRRLRAESLTWQAVDDELVVLDLVDSRYLSLNPTGRVLWERLVDGAELEDLAAELVKVFPIDADTARADAAAFLLSLDERGLLEPDGS